MNISRMLAVCAVLALVAGCANVEPYKAKLPNVTQNCVGAWSRIPVHDIATPVTPEAMPPYGEFADVAHCLGKPALEKPTPVVMYAIDKLPRPTELDVDAEISMGGTMAVAVDLLDGTFQVIRHYGFAKFTHRGGEFSLPLFINVDDADLRYLAVHPDPGFVGKAWNVVGSFSSNTPIFVFPGLEVFVPTGHETNEKHEFTPGGLFRVVRAGGTPAPAGSSDQSAP